MSRARYLKPSFFTNERIGELAPFERLAWQGLWCQADREGRLKDRPRRLKIEILPYDDIDFDAILATLHERNFIVRYEVSGERFIAIPSFLEHQRPHPKEPQSILPEPPEASMIHASTMHAADMKEPSRMLPGKDPLNGMIIKSESLPESGEPAGRQTDGNLPSAPPNGRRTKRATFIPLSEEERQKLLTDFPGSEEQIELALAHEAHWKYPTGQYLYVRNWLKRPAIGGQPRPEPSRGIEFVNDLPKPRGITVPDMGFRDD